MAYKPRIKIGIFRKGSDVVLLTGLNPPRDRGDSTQGQTSWEILGIGTSDDPGRKGPNTWASAERFYMRLSQFQSTYRRVTPKSLSPRWRAWILWTARGEALWFEHCGEAVPPTLQNLIEKLEKITGQDTKPG